MKKWIFLAVLATLIGGGIFFVIPQVLYYRISSDIASQTSVTISGREKAARFLGGMTIHDAHIGFQNNMMLTAKWVDFDYAFLDVIRLSRYPLTISGRDIVWEMADAPLFGIKKVVLHNLDMYAEIAKGQQISFENIECEGDFGRVSGSGVITLEETLNIELTFELEKEYFGDVPLAEEVFSSGDDTAEIVSITIQGSTRSPDISVFSKRFQLSLRGNEST